MAVTLADAKLLTQDKLTQDVIDEFRKDDLLNLLVFDNCVALNGGSTLAYTYNRVLTNGTAAFREINNEYTPQEAKTKQYTTNLKVFGGSFENRSFYGKGGLYGSCQPAYADEHP